MRFITKYGLILTTILFTFANFAYAQGAMRVVKTGIPVHYRGKVAVGDSIIVYGTGVNKGVDYIKSGDKKGRGIPGGDSFSAMQFAVVKDKIFLLELDTFGYHVFDTVSGKLSQIDGLKNRGLSPLLSDGNYVLAITVNESTNKNQLTVIDLSGNEPNIILNQPLWQGAIRIQQAAISAQSSYLAVSTGDEIGAIMFKTGDTEAVVHKVADDGGVSVEQMTVSGNKVFYFSAESGKRNLMELDLATGLVKKLALNPASTAVASNGGTIAYFAARDAKDRHGMRIALVVMMNGGQAKVVVAADNLLMEAQETTDYRDLVVRLRLRQTDVQYLLPERIQSEGLERLQLYDGKTLKLFPDTASRPPFLQASDVSVNASFAAFKIGTDAKTELGYIRFK